MILLLRLVELILCLFYLIYKIDGDADDTQLYILFIRDDFECKHILSDIKGVDNNNNYYYYFHN